MWMKIPFSTAILQAVLWGFIATILELFTPAGFDNLSIPLAISFGYYYISFLSGVF
jgi:dolichol kinase